MKIPPFELERYFAKYEFNAPQLLCCSDCESLSVRDLLDMEPGAADALQSLWLGYTESPGHPELRDQIARLYTETRAEHILVHTGAEEAIFNFMNAVLEPDDHIIVQSPCYQSLSEVARSIGCDVTLWQAREANNWRPDPEFLRKNIRKNTRAVIVNCPHNPTGYLMAEPEFRELVRLSRQHGFLIFSDEVYRFLEYDENDRLPALCDIDERGVSLGVMSKSFGLAGLRVGWIATRNRELFKKMAAIKDYTTICNSAPGEFLATVALKHRKALVHRNLGIIGENLGILNAFFTRHEAHFRWRAPKAGPIAFPSLKGDADANIFCHQLREKAGVLLLPGSLYGDFTSNFRVGFGRINLPECVEKLDEYLGQTRKKRI
ncbi:aspartate aminotransferase [Desulfonema ishimotonii]|uniref:Aspartate aminotransferase n=1 Tax=Desulfonema ishimotonii TaxID=45657 RepID=A0A401FQG9_9BACT|nr:aminotransferase class I/II-fold pyridoxal phosphate-dependent enzyme [Desulfonema ishimotonii]GBC59226.1 aspartate aminotransferase [Desulfonema ishimotonii]